MKAEKKTDKQVELYSKRKLNKLNVGTAGSAVTQPKVSQESKNPAKRAPRKSDTDNHGILEGISSLHTWIKTQTMIRLVPAAFLCRPLPPFPPTLRKRDATYDYRKYWIVKGCSI